MSAMEKKMLEKLAQAQLMSKSDLKSFFRENGSSSTTIFETTLKNLASKAYISPIMPLGSTSFVITQKGLKVLESLK